MWSRSSYDNFVRSVFSHRAMSLLLFALYACSYYGVTAPVTQLHPGQTSWHSESVSRGTWGLLSSCVITMGICVWSAVHLNVPGQPPQDKWKRYIHQLRKARWTFMGLFAPELVVYCAWVQWSDARELTRSMNRAKHNRKHPWTLAHSFFAGMGGFAIDSSEFWPEQDLIYLTAAGALRMTELDYQLPDLPKKAIEDKSKADSLGKILVCLQAGYMIFQVLGRLIAHLPVTLLEINTLGHVLCALAMYAFWFHKPLGVCDPTLLAEEWAKQLMLLWFMKNDSGRYMQDFSSKTNQTREYRELDLLMLFAHPERREQIEYDFRERLQAPLVASIQPGLKLELLTRAHQAEDGIASNEAKSSGEVGAQCTPTCADLVVREDLPKDLEGLSDHRVLFFRQSGSSTNLKNDVILRQLQNSKLWGSLTQVYRCDEEDQLETWWERWSDRVAPEIYMGTIRNGRVVYDTKKPASPFRGQEPSAFIPQHIYLDGAGLRRWEVAYRALERDPCVTLYVTADQVDNNRDMQRKALRTGLVVQRVCNWPSPKAGLLSSWKTPAWIMGAVTALYGGLHALCWHSHFPSVAETMLWRTSSLVIAGGPATITPLFYGWVYVDEMLVLGIRNTVWDFVGFTTMWLAATVYVAARLFILLEAFISLRNLLDAAYQTPNWTTWLPHL